ncbi:MAG TPA: sialidase family protein [Actinomycetota bacterium]
MARDRTGGWVVRALAIGALLAGTAGLVPSQAAEGDLVILSDQQVSRYTLRTEFDCAPGFTTTTCHQTDTETEPSIAVNPENPLNAVVAVQQGRRDDGGAVVNGYATTVDGGRTWTSGRLPGTTKVTGGPFDRASDPVVVFGPDDLVYAQSLLFNNGGNRRALWNNVSRDGGLTWEPGAASITTDDTYGSTDKNWLTVDVDDAPGHHEGRIYVAWDRIAPVSVAYSDDQGATWHIQDIGYTTYPGQGIGALPLVLDDGGLAVLWATLAYPLPPARPGEPAESVEEGASGLGRYVLSIAPKAGTVPTAGPLVFTPPVTVGVDLGRPTRGQRAGDGLPQAFVDPNSGRIYVAWQDARFRDDEVNDIVITWSDDDGITWSPVKPVDPGPRNNWRNRFLPMIGVGEDGALWVAYREREENAGIPHFFSPQVDTMLQVSRDGGETFSAPMKVNRSVSDMGFGTRSRGGVFLGDYHQLAVAQDRTYITHTEPVRVSAREEAQFPPAYHHQRTWVSVVGEQPAAVSEPKAQVKGTRTGRTLPATGVPFIPVALVALGMAGIVAESLRRAR